MRPTRRHISISPSRLIRDAIAVRHTSTPRRPASGSVLSLAILCRHVALRDPGKPAGTRPLPSAVTPTPSEVRRELPVSEGRVCAAGGRASEPAEQSAAGGEVLYLIPRKQVGIHRGHCPQSSAQWRRERSPRAYSRGSAANGRWEKYARQQSDLVGSLRKINRFYFDRLANQVEECHRSFRGYRAPLACPQLVAERCVE